MAGLTSPPPERINRAQRRANNQFAAAGKMPGQAPQAPMQRVSPGVYRNAQGGLQQGNQAPPQQMPPQAPPPVQRPTFQTPQQFQPGQFPQMPQQWGGMGQGFQAPPGSMYQGQQMYPYGGMQQPQFGTQGGYMGINPYFKR